MGCADTEHGNNIDTDDLSLREAETGDLEADEVADPDIIPGHYIVMLKKGVNPHAVAAVAKAKPNHVYTLGISGFAAPLNKGQLNALSHHKDVVRIEQDQIVTAAAVQCPNTCPQRIQYKGSPDYAPAYSVDRIDQIDRPFSNSYSYKCSGDNVKVYIVDTWMQTNHADFGGRASLGWDGYPNEPANGEACEGHATHVAGIVGGTLYGVAKDVDLISVEVLDCTGHGTWSKLLAGIDWIMDHKGNSPAVANMSLGGTESSIVDSAVNELADSGVFVAVAAGNDNQNACNRSPSGAAKAMTVAANNSNDERATFSNYGSCVDIYAGGTNVRSDWPDGVPHAGTGTSMASPHVAGVAALYKQTFGNVASAEIHANLASWASAGKIVNNPVGTPNLLLYWPCSGG